jgi:ABC-type microcin C transport system permease subunit YejE
VDEANRPLPTAAEWMDMRRQFLECLGYANLAELIAASKPVVLQHDCYWYTTKLKDGRFADWTDSLLAPVMIHYFKTEKAAIKEHRRAYDLIQADTEHPEKHIWLLAE